MRSRRMTICVVAIVVVLISTSISQAVTMDWVTVGNSGNAGDTQIMNDITTGYGSVSGAYQIGKYEVTAGQYTEFLNSVAASDIYGLYNTNMDSSIYGSKIQRSGISGSYTYSVASDRADRPVNYVSFFDSLRFSNWMHNGQGAGDTEDGAYDMSLGASVVRKAGATVFLPSEDEWYKAAFHKNDGATGNYFNYPTSSNAMPGQDITEATNPGNNANYYDGSYVIGSPYYRTEAGEFELSDSPYGTFDMGGNLWEWNEAIMSTVTVRGLRGGAYNVGANSMASSYRFNASISYEELHVGFRIASIPEPVTIALLGLGGLFLRKRSK